MRLLFALAFLCSILFSSCTDRSNAGDEKMVEVSLNADHSSHIKESQTSKPISAWDALSGNHIHKLDTLIDKRYATQNISELKGLKNELENTLNKSHVDNAKLYAK